MNKEKSQKKHLYEEIAENLATKILKGVFKFGEKLPPVREISMDLGVSISSIVQSYALLERQGLIEARPQSGFYVKEVSNFVLAEPQIKKFNIAVNHYYGEELVSEVNEESILPNIIPLGAGIPYIENMPYKKLNKATISICRSYKNPGITHEFPPGNLKLRRQIAKQSIKWGKNDTSEDIIITTGATEALALSLRAVAKPGEAVIVESPGYFGILQIIETLGMQVLEIPTDPNHGLDIESLNKALTKHNVGACVLCPTIGNPLCSVMPDENKKEVYKILSSRGVPIIEDDVYSDLYFGDVKPRPIKSLDAYGQVIYISSFSKTVAPGYRVGWISPGIYYEKIKRLKFASSLGSPSITQMAMAEFLRQGEYEKNLKVIRKIYEKQILDYSGLLKEYFPVGTRVSRPQGGYYLWVELPGSISSIELQKEALKEKISITPGPLFSTKKDVFLNYIRLNCAFPTDMTGSAIKTLGNICKSMNAS